MGERHREHLLNASPSVEDFLKLLFDGDDFVQIPTSCTDWNQPTVFALNCPHGQELLLGTVYSDFICSNAIDPISKPEDIFQRVDETKADQFRRHLEASASFSLSPFHFTKGRTLVFKGNVADLEVSRRIAALSSGTIPVSFAFARDQVLFIGFTLDQPIGFAEHDCIAKLLGLRLGEQYSLVGRSSIQSIIPIPIDSDIPGVCKNLWIGQRTEKTDLLKAIAQTPLHSSGSSYIPDLYPANLLQDLYIERVGPLEKINVFKSSQGLPLTKMLPKGDEPFTNECPCPNAKLHALEFSKDLATIKLWSGRISCAGCSYSEQIWTNDPALTNELGGLLVRRVTSTPSLKFQDSDQALLASHLGKKEPRSGERLVQLKIKDAQLNDAFRGVIKLIGIPELLVLSRDGSIYVILGAECAPALDAWHEWWQSLVHINGELEHSLQPPDVHILAVGDQLYKISGNGKVSGFEGCEEFTAWIGLKPCPLFLPWTLIEMELERRRKDDERDTLFTRIEWDLLDGPDLANISKRKVAWDDEEAKLNALRSLGSSVDDLLHRPMELLKLGFSAGFIDEFYQRVTEQKMGGISLRNSPKSGEFLGVAKVVKSIEKNVVTNSYAASQSPDWRILYNILSQQWNTAESVVDSASELASDSSFSFGSKSVINADFSKVASFHVVPLPAGKGKSKSVTTAIGQDLLRDRWPGLQSMLLLRQRVEDAPLSEVEINLGMGIPDFLDTQAAQDRTYGPYDHLADLDRKAINQTFPWDRSAFWQGLYRSRNSALIFKASSEKSAINEASFPKPPKLPALRGYAQSIFSYKAGICIWDKRPSKEESFTDCLKCPMTQCRNHKEMRDSLDEARIAIGTHAGFWHNTANMRKYRHHGKLQPRQLVVFDEKPEVLKLHKVSLIELHQSHQKIIYGDPKKATAVEIDAHDYIAETLKRISPKLSEAYSDAVERLGEILRTAKKAPRLRGKLKRGTYTAWFMVNQGLGLTHRQYQGISAAITTAISESGFTEKQKNFLREAVTDVYALVGGYEKTSARRVFLKLERGNRERPNHKSEKITLTVVNPRNRWPEIRKSFGKTSSIQVLDATAPHDPDYLLPGSPTLLRLNVQDDYAGKLEFRCYRERDLSRSKLGTDHDASVALIDSAITSALATMHEDILVVVPNERLSEFEVKYPKGGRVKLDYHGNMIGKNDYQNCGAVVLGFIHRLPEEIDICRSFFIVPHRDLSKSQNYYPGKWTPVNSLTKKANRKDKQTSFVMPELELLRTQAVAVELIQTIKRTRLRRIESGRSKNPVQVWIPTENPYLLGHLLNYFKGATIVKATVSDNR